MFILVSQPSSFPPTTVGRVAETEWGPIRGATRTGFKSVAENEKITIVVALLFFRALDTPKFRDSRKKIVNKIYVIGCRVHQINFYWVSLRICDMKYRMPM